MIDHKQAKAAGTPSSSASAPAKLILCGEHAVVYGRPAIALPLDGIRARVTVADGRPGQGMIVHAHDLRRRWRVADDPSNPLSLLISSVLAHLANSYAHPIERALDLRITIHSAIPIASGMGSGAAVATALARTLAAHLGHALPADETSSLVYASEQRYHGTPSGIDNTVIAYEQPIWFQRTKDAGEKTKAATAESSSVLGPPSPLIQPITIATPFTLLIGDTGVRSPTRLPVGQVRQRWQEQPGIYEALFDQVAELVECARAALEGGDIRALGAQLDRNQALLEEIGVSSPPLDALVAAARAAGALGAKLSGAGWGGVMLALVTPENCAQVSAALTAAGAQRVIETTVQRHTVQEPE